jgi:hypothetical protein
VTGATGVATALRVARRICSALLGLSILGTGCASLLGIEEATCDPEKPDCAGSPTGSGGAHSPDAASEAGAAEPGSMTADPGALDSGSLDASVDAASLSPRQTACRDYCVTIQQACVETNAQYQSEESCLEICNELMRTEAEREDAGGSVNDTIECRLAAARAVIEVGAEIDNLCVSAGMWGNDECGAPCEVYCSMMSAACAEQFESFDSCPDECDEVQPGGKPFGVMVDPGNTLECRVNHIRLATTTRNPETHCPHAAGVAVCIP